MSPRRTAAAALLAALSAAPAAAQLEAYDVRGNGNSHYGRETAVLGDVDGDGVNDWANGDPYFSPGGVLYAGRVWVRSGVDGSLVWRATGAAELDVHGRTIAGMSDVDGDGRAEVAVVSFAGGRRIQVRSGLDGAVLFTVPEPAGAVQWCHDLFRIGDVTGDGIDELAATTQSTSGWPDTIYVHSGADGALVRTLGLQPMQSATQFGVSVDDVGDLDGDGLAETVVGAPMFCGGCVSSFPGGVYVFRGADGSLLREHHATSGVEELGANVVGLPDCNADGVPDYAARAQFPGEVVRLYSGSDGALLHQFAFGGGGPVVPGAILEALDDLDGDGAPELVACPVTTGDAPYFSIATCAPPWTEFERVPGRFAGDFLDVWHLESPGDLTGDGTPDLLVAEPAWLDHLEIPYPDGRHVGRVALVALDELSVDAALECTSTPNSTGLEARIWYEGSLRASDQSLAIVAWNLPPSLPGVVYHGRTAVQTPFGNGFRCATGDVVRLGAVFSGPDGIVEVPVAPADMPLPGVETRFQYWFRDPGTGNGGFDLTDAVAVVMAP